ncbi:hypothetical protein RRG08_051883 [Elysia crispata]|uniref:Uncharacterized protein n=1 Tax=Elysia crispata TaxID=231223 RepID=A0AAE0ZAB3_9GAST|nr:hypothetical protein RRG08_051883 [Elysia crispata]
MHPNRMKWSGSLEGVPHNCLQSGHNEIFIDIKYGGASGNNFETYQCKLSPGCSRGIGGPQTKRYIQRFYP